MRVNARCPSRIGAVPLLALGLLLSAAGPAAATTLIRQGLEQLTADNQLVLHGRVVSVHSYWNDDRSFILTDVSVRPHEVLKGGRTPREVTFTLLGGTVGDVTTLIVGGPELVPGSDYVIFLSRENLIADRLDAMTVRDLVQGVFDVVRGPRGTRAVSQANHHPLLPDAAGADEPPGGGAGFALDDMLLKVRGLAGGR